QTELLVRRGCVPVHASGLLEVAAQREQPSEAGVDTASQRGIEIEFLGKALDAADGLVDGSRAVPERLSEQPGERPDHPDARPRPTGVLECALVRLAPCPPATGCDIAAAPQPPGPGERELVPERFELGDRLLGERDALLGRCVLGEGADEL